MMGFLIMTPFFVAYLLICSRLSRRYGASVKKGIDTDLNLKNMGSDSDALPLSLDLQNPFSPD